jgi:hypothetical protein
LRKLKMRRGAGEDSLRRWRFLRVLPPARSEPAAAGRAPSALTEEAAAQPAPAPPVRVLVGAYINDIQELDFKTQQLRH